MSNAARFRAPDKHCAHEDCEATIRDHHWGVVKSGWFIQRDGKAFCTKHIPEWVAEWRARRT